MTKEELKDVLKEIWDDKDFILGVSLCMPNDEERQILADMIRNGELKGGGEIVRYAFNVYTETHPANVDDEVER